MYPRVCWRHPKGLRPLEWAKKARDHHVTKRVLPDRFAGGRSPEQKPTFMLSEEVSRPAHGTQIYVFGLPDKMQ